MSGFLRKVKQGLAKALPELAQIYLEQQIRRRMKRFPLRKVPFGFFLAGHDAMQNGTFEPDEVKFLRERLELADVFVDVGANVGYFTCLARSMGKYTLAVEPLSHNLAYLYLNLEANGWRDVEVIPVGLSNRTGLSVLYGGGTAASLMKHWAGASENLKFTTPLSTLDIILGERFLGRKLIIKIDVEGVEYEVVSGAANTLRMTPSPDWLVEICFDEHHPAGYNPQFHEVFNVFWESGYRALWIGQDIRPVLEGDVVRWVTTGRHDWGGHNYFFTKD